VEKWKGKDVEIEGEKSKRGKGENWIPACAGMTEPDKLPAIAVLG
jgi:hypothetical protein